MLSRTAVLIAALVLAPLARSADGPAIDLMDDVHFRPTGDKARVELVEGRVGKAVRFAFDAQSTSVFCASSLHGTPEWDGAAGFSFWLKGDGSDSSGGLEFIWNEDYAVRYDYCFPLRNAEWHKVTVAWGDLIPSLPGPNARLLGGPTGNAPSRLTAMWFGKWWYWADYPAHSFTIDDIRLEASIPRGPSQAAPTGAPLARVLARLKAGKPVTIVTMGDSLTDTHHWSNRQTCWPALLADKLRAKYRSEVTVVNPAIGGTQLRQNLVLMPRWLAKTPEPDLVTVFFGGNDWESGMRGPQFEEACRDAVDRIRRATHGKADVLLMTTAPSVAQWETHAELAEACRAAARPRPAGRGAGLADVERAFLQAGGTDPAAREPLFVWDRVHLGPAGQQLTAEVVLRAIEAGGR